MISTAPHLPQCSMRFRELHPSVGPQATCLSLSTILSSHVSGDRMLMLLPVLYDRCPVDTQ